MGFQKMKTTAQRVSALRERRKALGLVRLELYVHPDDKPAVLALAQKLTDERKASAKR
jgi:hypothetical protein